MKQPAVYIMASRKNGAIYTGVTSNLVKRAYEHRCGLVKGFTKRYDCNLFVFFEIHEVMESAIMREKQIKSFVRKKKIALIQEQNPQWIDLYEKITK